MEFDINITGFDDIYADDISSLIYRNLFEVNIKDYPRAEMNKVAAKTTAEKLKELAKFRKILIAVSGNKAIGTLSIAESFDSKPGEYWFLTVFVQPEYHRKGVGALLIKKGEEYVLQKSGSEIIIPSSITSHGFYRKMGYQYKDGNTAPDPGGTITMLKSFTV